MIFPSIAFAIFYPIVLCLSWALMPRAARWKPFILVASYVFYASADPRFCLLLAGATLFNQLAAVLLGRTSAPSTRKAIVTVAVTGDLLSLGVFKYYSFFAQQVDDVLNRLHLGLPLPLLTIALPVGISFFTFQAISYVVDVYRGEVERASLMDFAIYLSFFSHLVAGPIVRAKEFLPQLASPRDPEHVAVSAGVGLIALGLVKKVVIADFLARSIADPVFAVPQAYGAPDVILAAYAYAAQIYCDFSGYTDMAIGLALLLGFEFPQNFDRPYRSLGFREFWRRWHMTLSRFLRDFLYIPLGGNRGGEWFRARNLMLTMVLGGLWHGAAWTFVLWGTFQGAGLVIEHLIIDHTNWRAPAWVRWLITFNLIVFGWVLFRSTSLSLAGTFLSRLAHWSAPTLWSVPVVVAVAGTIGLQLLPTVDMTAVRARVDRASPILLGAGLGVLIVVVGATVSSQGVPPFIYFRF